MFMKFYEDNKSNYIQIKSKTDQRRFSKPKSAETKTKESVERVYNKRSNICSKCFTAKSTKTQECLCS